MAKQTNPHPAVEAKAGAAGAAGARPSGRPRYEIRTLGNPGFCGERSGDGKRPAIKFRDGVAETDDEVGAAHCINCRYMVTDRETGKVYNGPEEQK